MFDVKKFFICEHCGNIIGWIENKGVPIKCCGQEVTELIANTVDASVEKHLPQVTKSGDSIVVSVGSVEHPMTEEHNIKFVYVESQHGGQRKCVPIGQKPVYKFSFIDDKPVAVYAYCNLHGLWKTIVE